jgi:hypothetical protein
LAYVNEALTVRKFLLAGLQDLEGVLEEVADVLDDCSKRKYIYSFLRAVRLKMFVNCPQST